MKNILETIIAHKRVEVAERKVAHPLQTGGGAKKSNGRSNFWDIFENGNNALIAEIKPKSPSHGTLTTDPLTCAHIYATAPVDCISVLTDEKFFGGSIELLKSIRLLTEKPLFCKDFVIDSYQILEAAEAGADAILFIASVLDAETLLEFIQEADTCGMGYIVETHTEADIQKALACRARCIGINNRDLTTLTITLETTESLIHCIPSHVYVVSESGIKTTEDVTRLRRVGVRGILVGASILHAENQVDHITQLKNSLL